MSLYVDIRKTLGDFTLETKFEVQDGVTGILGASGCGKSMTLRCIAGIMKPDEGHIELNGKVLFDSSRKINVRPQDRHVGLLFQNYALFPNMTVQQNLMAGLMACEKNKNAASQKIREILERFELNGLEQHKPSELSGGQQQRVALARIFLSSPDILMLDEPFSALDGYLRWNLEQELLDVLKDFAGPTLFVSHSRDEVYRICDHVCVMDHGISSSVIPVKQLFEAPESRAAACYRRKNFARAKVTKAASANNRATFMYRIGARHFPIRECLPKKSSILESAVIIFILSLSRKRLLIRKIHFHVIWKRSLMMYFQRCSWYVLSMQKAQKRAENSILIKSVWR